MSKKTERNYQQALVTARGRLAGMAQGGETSTQAQLYDFDSLKPGQVIDTVLALGFSEDEANAWLKGDPSRVLSSEEQASFLNRLKEGLPKVTGGRRLERVQFGWLNSPNCLQLYSGILHTLPGDSPYREFDYAIEASRQLFDVNPDDDDIRKLAGQTTSLEITIKTSQKPHAGSHDRLQPEPTRSIKLPGDDAKITNGAILETMRILTHVRNFSNADQFPPLHTARR